MQVLTDPGEIAVFCQSHDIYMALGYFDGVHLGHQSLLAAALRLAREGGGTAGILLLEPHSSKVLGGPPVRNLTVLAEKIRWIQAYGDFQVFVLPFQADLAALTPEAFVREYLVRLFRVKMAVCGYNYSFGHRGQGDGAALARLGAVYGFGCEIQDRISHQGETVSSTAIRSLIAAGRMKPAAALLGHHHVYAGEVVGGRRLGTQMGFPTANLALPEDLLWPAYGVYGGFVRDANGRVYRGLVNVGVKPTLARAGQAPAFEVHLLNFAGDLYGRVLQVALTNRLRPEQAFDGLDALRRQIIRDQEKIRWLLDAWENVARRQRQDLAAFFTGFARD